jgi:3-phenylpropionate/cinnamic acid dioxygenase small subunit
VSGFQELLDREAIRELLALYAYGLDFQDWGALERCFTEDGVYDMHDYFMRLGLDVPAARGRDDIIGGLKTAAAAGGATLQHFFTNPMIDLNGDRADVKSYVLVHTSRAGDAFLTGAVWEDRVVRTGAGWRIAHRYLRYVWSQGAAEAVLGLVREALRDPAPR